MKDMCRSLASYGAVLLVACGVLAGLVATNVIGLRYPVGVENDPLQDPVTVTDIGEDYFLLEDGRRFEVRGDSRHASFADRIRRSDYQVEIDYLAGEPVVYFSEPQGGVCGTPYASSLVRINLIPDPVPNRRRGMMFAEFEEVEGVAER